MPAAIAVKGHIKKKFKRTKGKEIKEFQILSISLFRYTLKDKTSLKKVICTSKHKTINYVSCQP